MLAKDESVSEACFSVGDRVVLAQDYVTSVVRVESHPALQTRGHAEQEFFIQ